MSRRLISILAFLVLLAVPLTYNACSLADFRFAGDGGTQSAGSTGGNPMLPMSVAPFTPARTYQACLDAIDFRLFDGTIIPYPISAREITISHAGTDLGQLDIPDGNYEKIYFYFRKNCAPSATLPAGASFIITNSNGTFGTAGDVRLAFYGTFTLPDPQDRSLVLGMDLIVNELESVTSNAEVQTKAQAQGGSMVLQ